MTGSATGLSRSARLIGAALLFCGSPLAAQDQPERVTDRDPDAMDVATTPIQDLNLSSDPIPEALQDAVVAPYASETLVGCDDLNREIERLNVVLGPDLDIDTEERRDITIGKVAKSAVGSLIPFRGVIREISGAADRERDFQEAILAGAVRRGYLKGLGEQRGCAYPARPADVKITISDDDEVEMTENEDAGSEDDGEVTFVSGEVVQGD